MRCAERADLWRWDDVRDWLHVEDDYRAVRLVEHGRIGESYNLGGGEELSNLAVIGGASVSLRTYVNDRQGHDRRYATDETNIQSKLGYVPARDFETALAGTRSLGMSLASRGGEP